MQVEKRLRYAFTENTITKTLVGLVFFFFFLLCCFLLTKEIWFWQSQANVEQNLLFVAYVTLIN